MTERLLHSVPPGESLNKFYQSASVLGPLLFGEPMTEALLNRAASRPLGERRTQGGRITGVRSFQSTPLIQCKHRFVNPRVTRQASHTMHSQFSLHRFGALQN